MKMSVCSVLLGEVAFHIAPRGEACASDARSAINKHTV
jgi:hypothetical protein